MPSKNVTKQFVEGGYYHAYNRGVEKRNIFLDEMDYRVFISRIVQILSPVSPQAETSIRLKNYVNEIELVAFCLMPNHFHLLIKQVNRTSMTAFMRTLCTSYSMYFNAKYKRVGRLFQGSYKATQIESGEYITHLSRYIHRNPLVLGFELENYQYSSFNLLRYPPSWLRHDIVNQSFRSIDEYLEFVLDESQAPDEILNRLILEEVEKIPASTARITLA
ncbi:transposase [Candidatus Saccharibacteria bacterium]|nr:transposase [Candidatus Saccharibacteria bacterium]